jgi:hypothetical protein
MLFNVVLLHVFTFFVHVVMSWGSCCSMLSYYMCSQHEQKTWTHVIRHHWTTWAPGHHNMNKKREQCNKTPLNIMNPRTFLGFMLFNVVLLHVFTFFVHVVMSWGSCCSMLSYYMCSRFLVMLWCPGVHVVQCCLIICVHVFCSCCDVLWFMMFNVVLLHVFTFFVYVVISWCSCCSMLSYYMYSRLLFMLWCPRVHVVQCCLITCVHVFCSCCDVLGFMLFIVVLLHVFTNMNPRTSQHEQKTWTHVIR